MALQRLSEARCKKGQKGNSGTTLMPDLALFGDKKKVNVVLSLRFALIKQRRTDSGMKK